MRILIATVTAGGGHIAAAAALEEAWHALRPDDVVERLDLIKFFSPLHKKIHVDGYVKLVEKAPELWGLIFEKTDNPTVTRRMSRLRRAFPSASRAKFARHLQPFSAAGGAGPAPPKTGRRPRRAEPAGREHRHRL